MCIKSTEAAALSHRMRSLETAAQAGVLIVAALAAIIVAEAARSGFPAIRSGELPLLGPQGSAALPAGMHDAVVDSCINSLAA